MVTNVCNRVGTFFKEHPTAVDRAITAGVAGLSWYLAGVPAMIVGLGSYVALRKMNPLPAPEKSLDVPHSYSDWDEKELDVSRLQIHNSNQLNLDAGKPPTRLTNGGNCCFLSAPSWALFLNEPVILDEIPKAILRRLDETLLFPTRLDAIAMRPALSEAKRNALLNIAIRLRDGKPKKMLDFLIICKQLRTLERGGLPAGMNHQKANELLSLLELYTFITDCQLADAPIPGSRINQLRQAIQRVRPTFREIGTEMGDSHEAMIAFTDLIFEGSDRNRDLVTNRVCEAPKRSFWQKSYRLRDDQGVNPVTGEVQTVEKNWGHFEMEVMGGQSIQQTLNNTLHSRESFTAKFLTTDGGNVKRDFNVKSQSLHFSQAPDLLVLTIKRYAEPNAVVDAEEFLTIDGDRCSDCRGAMYQLHGVVKNHSQVHYTADVRKDDQWYYCNDLGTTVRRTDTHNGNTGYILVYRKLLN